MEKKRVGGWGGGGGRPLPKGCGVFWWGRGQWGGGFLLGAPERGGGGGVGLVSSNKQLALKLFKLQIVRSPEQIAALILTNQL